MRVASRAPEFLGAVEYDERALLQDPKFPAHVFLRIEVDFEARISCELRAGEELGHNGLLRFACRAPICIDIDQYRLTARLQSLKRRPVKRLGLSSVSRDGER